MYQVTVKGTNLNELKTAMKNIYEELNGTTLVKGMEKDLKKIVEAEEPVKEVKEEPVKESVELNMELDADGIPWDKRIHAGSKAKLKDGTWRLKRNIEDDLVKEVKAELKQKVEQAANPAPIPAAPINENTPVVTPEVEQPAPKAEPVKEMQAQPIEPQRPPQPQMTQGHTVETFSQNFPMILGQLLTNGTVTNEYLETLKNYFKVDQIWNINEEQKKEMFNSFVEYGFIQKVG